MPHYTPLITTIVAALTLAWAFAAVAHKVKLPPLVGYLLAGIVIGPFTPGYVADQNLASQLAEIGVILLMFGVGLHFSLEDLLSVKKIAIPGAIVQIACATLLGMGLAAWLGWEIGAGLVFGLALSVASTVVLLRALQERRLVETERGRIAVGWLIVEDVAMVLALVLLPVVAGLLQGEGASVSEIALALGITAAKVAAFVAVMLIVGKRVIPWILHAMAHTGSRELFRLSVLVIALGVAFGAAELFGVSFALGAFFAGMILSEVEIEPAGRDRDAAVARRLRRAVLRLGRHAVRPHHSRARAVAGIGDAAHHPGRQVARGLCHRARLRLCQCDRAHHLDVAGANRRVLLHPRQSRRRAPAAPRAGARSHSGRRHHLDAAQSVLVLRLGRAAGAAGGGSKRAKPEAGVAPSAPIGPTDLKDHVVLVGHGRVGKTVSKVLGERGIKLFVIEDDKDVAAEAKTRGIAALAGNAADPQVIEAANLPAARCLLVAIPDAFEGGQVVQQARAVNPSLTIIARAHSEAEILHLKKHGASLVIMGEHEIAMAMVEHVATGAETGAKA